MSKKNIGRPKFQPSEFQRRVVMKLARDGRKLATIADVIEISEPTLKAYFRDELVKGRLEFRSDLYDAIKARAERGNLSAIILMLRMLARADAREDPFPRRSPVRPWKDGL